jgi:threonine/homoserine/homoserine lactone efflux protein
MTLDTLFVFLPISLLLILAPGPDSILVLTRGITMGRRAAIISATGVSIGLVCHSLFAAAGLSAIVQRSAAAFSIVKYLGAAYFLFLGVRALLGRGETDFSASARTGIGTGRIFIQGMLSNLLNPRIVIFFLAYLPQFASARSGHLAVELLALGLLFASLTWTILIGYAWCSGMIGTWVRQRPSMTRVIDRLTGIVFIGLGLRLALTKRG